MFNEGIDTSTSGIVSKAKESLVLRERISARVRPLRGAQARSRTRVRVSRDPLARLAPHHATKITLETIFIEFIIIRVQCYSVLSHCM